MRLKVEGEEEIWGKEKERERIIRKHRPIFLTELFARFIFTPFLSTLEKKERGRTVRGVQLKGTNYEETPCLGVSSLTDV